MFVSYFFIELVFVKNTQTNKIHKCNNNDRHLHALEYVHALAEFKRKDPRFKAFGENEDKYALCSERFDSFEILRGKK